MPDPAVVRADYARKASSYTAKYGMGYYTHIHTGLYDPESFPLLFSRERGFTRMGLDRLRFLLMAGQERLTNRVCSLLLKHNPHGTRILDCGAGHGGTSIYLAENFGRDVTAITISDLQRDLIVQNAARAGVTDRIQVLNADVFNCHLGESAYDAAIAIDSMCQIGRPDALFPILRSSLSPNGVMVISDYFIRNAADTFKSRFDDYWTSDISCYDVALHAGKEAGLDLLEYSDLTAFQIPFWKLSIAYTSLLLQGKIDDASEERRLSESRRFHSDMAVAFEDGRLSYAQIVLQRSEWEH